MKTAERRHWRRVGVFVVNFEHISHLVLVFLLLTLMYLQAGLFFLPARRDTARENLALLGPIQFLFDVTSNCL